MVMFETEGKVTLFEVFWRLILTFFPFILPLFFYNEGVLKAVLIWGLVYICVLGPWWFLPNLDENEWEENAKPFKIIFDSIIWVIGALLMLSLIFGAIKFLLFPIDFL